jgi:hypothetical protein
MDYKAVIEEQIRELQKVQDEAAKRPLPTTCCEIAKTIAALCREATQYPG